MDIVEYQREGSTNQFRWLSIFTIDAVAQFLDYPKGGLRADFARHSE